MRESALSAQKKSLLTAPGTSHLLMLVTLSFKVSVEALS